MNGRPYPPARYVEPPDVEDRLVSATRAAQFALDPSLHESVRRRILREVTWEVTELGSKYGTRYRSRGAVTLETEDRLPGWRSQLRHDHVIPRAELIRQLRADPGRADAILRTAVGCVVTKSEHDALGKVPAHLHGWERYLAAGVDVLDVATGRPYIENGRYSDARGNAETPPPSG